MKKRLSLLMIVTMLIGLFATTAAAAETQFSDVNLGDWFYDDVQYLVEQGGISGYPDGTFKPHGTITRHEFVSMVVRLLDSNGAYRAEAAENPNNEDYYSIEDITNAGVSWGQDILNAVYYSGLGSTIGAPREWDKEITRDEMAFLSVGLLSDIKGIKLVSTEGIYNNIADYKLVLSNKYSDAIFIAYSNGIFTGDENGNFNPLNNATRAEAAAVIARLIDEGRRVVVAVKEDIYTPLDFSDGGTVYYYEDVMAGLVNRGDLVKTVNGDIVPYRPYLYKQIDLPPYYTMVGAPTLPLQFLMLWSWQIESQEYCIKQNLYGVQPVTETLL